MFFCFFKGCVDAPQQPLGFVTTLKMWDLVRCLKPHNLHYCPQVHHVTSFGFVTTSVLDCQTHFLFSII